VNGAAVPTVREHLSSTETRWPPDRPDPAALWLRYEATGDAEPLLLHYHALVEQIARRMSADLPAFVERCDLVSYGVLGLVDAIARFDRTRGVQFETYSCTRIRGAIIDGLRSIDWIPRSVRTKLRAVARAEGALQMALHRDPTEAEVAAAVGMTVAALRKLAGEAALRKVVPLDDVRHASALDRISSRAAPGRDNHADQPGAALEADERTQAVAFALEGLSDRDRTVIDLYYYRGLKLTEIGRMLGVTEARVSQLHSRARSALRETLLAMDF
jgi:RNA polymerase sigma factor for flagellar operon FliA